jgi:hypothetical protein
VNNKFVIDSSKFVTHSSKFVICVVLFVIRVVLLLIVMFYVLFMCKCVLLPGGNPIAVDKYISINNICMPTSDVCAVVMCLIGGNFESIA